MSRDPFKGDQEIEAQHAEYQHGEGSLLDNIAEEAFSRVRQLHSNVIPRYWEDLFEELRVPEYDPQMLVDSVLHAMRGPYENNHDHPEELLNSLVQALYDMGHDDLVIDYSEFPATGKGGVDVGYMLQGSSTRPLAVSYIIPGGQYARPSIGEAAEYCRIQVQGPVGSTGKKAKDSSFYHSALPLNVGLRATGCDFYLDNILTVSPFGRDRRMQWSSISVRGPSGLTQLGVNMLSKKHANRLLVPDTCSIERPRWDFLYGEPPMLADSGEEGWLELQFSNGRRDRAGGDR